MPIRNRFAELQEEITAWRRDLHANPELQFDTVRTADFVAKSLRDFGCDEIVTGIGQTGVVGLIKGRAGQSGRTVGLRADMDALPILEETGLEYASKTDGKMHACGHDGHTAMLLGAAKYLAETRNFDGTVAVIFQPAEEGGGGGREMVKDGMMDRFSIDEVYGLHNVPGMPLGSFAIRSGAFYASTDELHITVKGRGGHAAQPHQTVDATYVAAQIIVGLQSVTSREVDPVKPAVVSVTTIQSSTDSYNVISEEVELKGTIRTMDAENREFVRKRVAEVVEGIAGAHGAMAECRINSGYPVVYNDESETEFAREAATRVAGECDEAPIYLWGEDFSYMLEERPGSYIHLGIGDAAALHHPKYNFNDDAIPAGCSFWVELAEGRLPITE